VTAAQDVPRLHPAASAQTPPRVPIVVVAGQLGIGGSERQLYLFLTQCDLSRWAPHVFASGSLGHWAEAIEELGIPVTLLRGRPAAKAWALRRAARRSGAQAFLSWSSYTNPYGLALLGLGMSRAGSFRNAGFADLPGRWRRVWSLLSRSAVSLAVCNSAETAAELRHVRRRPKDVVYLRNAVELLDDVKGTRARWRGRLGVDDELLVMGVGRICPQKNFERLVDVVARVSPGRHLRLVVAGPDLQGHAAGLRAHIERSGLPDTAVTLLGAERAARELLCAADVFVLSSDFEGMPNVVLEAMAAGVPVVSTRVNGVGSLLDDGVEGYLTDFDTPSLADPLARLADDAALRADMGARGRARVASGYAVPEVYSPLWRLLDSRLPHRRRRGRRTATHPPTRDEATL
jgi:glycosyltransferase involved in cell wall biosynthesis